MVKIMGSLRRIMNEELEKWYRDIVCYKEMHTEVNLK